MKAPTKTEEGRPSVLFSLTRPLAQPSAGEDGPQGANTEATNRENAGLDVPWAGRPGLVDAPGKHVPGWSGGQPQADAWSACADGASRAGPTPLLGGQVDAAGPSSERPEWEKSEPRPQCSGRQARWSSTGSGGQPVAGRDMESLGRG